MIGESKIQNKSEIVNIALYTEIIKSFGPSVFLDIGKPDLLNSKEEFERIKQHFLIEKLGLKNSPSLDKKLLDVFDIFQKSNKSGYLGIPYFYYLLVIQFKSSEVFLNTNIEKDNPIDVSQEMIDFGKNFIEGQVEIDEDIRKVTDENFFSLLL